MQRKRSRDPKIGWNRKAMSVRFCVGLNVFRGCSTHTKPYRPSFRVLTISTYKMGFDETTRFESDTNELGNVWSSFLMMITEIFYISGTMRQISRSHVISRFRPDLLPSLHKVTQIRHTFRQKKLWFCHFLSFWLKIMHIFICPEPRGPIELLKNAKNRFKIGFSEFPGRWHKYQNLVCIAKTSCLFRNALFYIAWQFSRLKKCFYLVIQKFYLKSVTLHLLKRNLTTHWDFRRERNNRHLYTYSLIKKKNAGASKYGHPHI